MIQTNEATISARAFPHRLKLQLCKVNTAKRWDDFFSLPKIIYTNDKKWVPPLLSEQKKLFSAKNPFLQKARYAAWLVFDGAVPVGRIVAYVDEAYNSFHGEQMGFFGFFECTPDKAAASLLLAAAQNWLKEEGAQKIRGPINFDTGNECGVLMEGAHYPPYLQMAHTPLYYKQLLEDASFEKAHDLLAFRIDLQKLAKDTAFLERLSRLANRAAEKEAWEIRPFSQRHFSKEVEKVHHAYNHWMGQNWGFSPVSKEELHFSAASLKSILKPELICFAHKGEELIGCCISLPDINQVLYRMNGKLFPFGFFRFLYYRPKINRARLMLLTVSPAYRNKGLDVFFYYHAIMQAIRLGYKEAELSWISEDNTQLLSIVKKFNAELYKQYRVFEKALL